jgi:hypothetical protein
MAVSGATNDPNVLQLLSSSFNTCTPLAASHDGDAVGRLLLYVQGAVSTLAMVDYPQASSFVTPMPALPVHVACTVLVVCFSVLWWICFFARTCSKTHTIAGVSPPTFRRSDTILIISNQETILSCSAKKKKRSDTILFDRSLSYPCRSSLHNGITWKANK